MLQRSWEPVMLGGVVKRWKLYSSLGRYMEKSLLEGLCDPHWTVSLVKPVGLKILLLLQPSQA